MNYAGKILFQSFVKPFYKENAGFFIFIFTMMFFIVSRLNGAGLFDYHYSLATGDYLGIGQLSLFKPAGTISNANLMKVYKN